MKRLLSLPASFLLACAISSIIAGFTAAILSMFSYQIEKKGFLFALASLSSLIIFSPVITAWSLGLAGPIAIISGLIVLLARQLKSPLWVQKGIAVFSGVWWGAFIGIALDGGREEWPGNWSTGLAFGAAGGLAGYVFIWVWCGGLRRFLN